MLLTLKLADVSPLVSPVVFVQNNRVIVCTNSRTPGVDSFRNKI